ncbi:MAG: hypothetical protein Q9220_000754 [cf. Caloplaca sp. 1 TL-2023]
MILGAGTEAVGATLAITTYHLLTSPHHLRLLLACLSTLTASDNTSMINSGILPYALLQQSPYLTACIKEGLRLTLESNRTVISCSLRDVHNHPSIFPNPHTFDPSRWLNNKNLEQYLVPFGRGSRACPGRAMAMEELVVILGNLITRFGERMRICEGVGKEEMRRAHDFFGGGDTSEGLRVMFV